MEVNELKNEDQENMIHLFRITQSLMKVCRKECVGKETFLKSNIKKYNQGGQIKCKTFPLKANCEMIRGF